MADSKAIGNCLNCGQNYCMNCSDAQQYPEYCSQKCEDENKDNPELDEIEEENNE